VELGIAFADRAGNATTTQKLLLEFPVNLLEFPVVGNLLRHMHPMASPSTIARASCRTPCALRAEPRGHLEVGDDDDGGDDETNFWLSQLLAIWARKVHGHFGAAPVAKAAKKPHVFTLQSSMLKLVDDRQRRCAR